MSMHEFELHDGTTPRYTLARGEASGNVPSWRRVTVYVSCVPCVHHRRHLPAGLPRPAAPLRHADPHSPRPGRRRAPRSNRSEEHTSELQSPYDLVCRLLLEKKKKKTKT